MKELSSKHFFAPCAFRSGLGGPEGENGSVETLWFLPPQELEKPAAISRRMKGGGRVGHGNGDNVTAVVPQTSGEYKLRCLSLYICWGIKSFLCHLLECANLPRAFYGYLEVQKHNRNNNIRDQILSVPE